MMILRKIKKMRIYLIIKNFFVKYKLILLGTTIFSLYFWNRFLGYKTSKSLPLNLDIIRLASIILTCYMFAIIIILLIKPYTKNDIIEKIIDWFFIPLKEFDNYIKNNGFIEPYHEKIIIYIMPILEYLIIKTHIFYIIFWVFPRLLLLTVLFIDVFIFHRFHFKYLVILFGVLLFFNRCFKYSLKNSRAYDRTITTLYSFYYHRLLS